MRRTGSVGIDIGTVFGRRQQVHRLLASGGLLDAATQAERLNWVSSMTDDSL